MREVFAFAVGIVGQEHTRVVNHRTPGRARADYLRDVRDVWPDCAFIDTFARKLGPPQTSDAFKRTARYRGMPDLKCGDRVEVLTPSGIARGVVVGHNESANFEVLFDDDSPHLSRLVLNVHPGDLRLEVEHAPA